MTEPKTMTAENSNRTTYWFNVERIAQLEEANAAQAAQIERLREALLAAKIPHAISGDSWYSCPLSDEGCSNPDETTGCTCGADRHNARIDAALKETT